MESYKILEKKFAAFVGSDYVVTCNSGTSALHLALIASGVGPGDEVIVPDFTMAAVAFAVSYAGAKPVFADVDIFDYSILLRDVEDLITEKTKAVIAVHTYGWPAPVESLKRLLKGKNIKLIEDVSEAHGEVYNSKADLSCYSFYKNKIIHAEEGGAVVTNSKKMAETIAYYKNMAFGKKHDYYHRHIGYNYRMPNSQADMALASLKDAKKNIAKRRLVGHWYNDELGVPREFDYRKAVWFYDAYASKSILKKCSDARDAFKPLSSLPMYGGGRGRLVARALSEDIVLLPVTPEMNKLQVKNICKMIRS